MENEEKTIQPKAIQIFAKAPGELGVNVVKSPVKLTILSMLKDTDMEFDEIVKNTGKSKSTISVHLKSLREDGIVSYRFDANDHRKKIFFINSKFLGEVQSGDEKELEERQAEFLVKNKENTVLQKMATPGKGTLSNRMLPLGNNLKAKTGTLADISSIAGFLTTKNGNKYAFCIMINDPSSGSSAKKNLEDYIIRDMYLNL